MHEIQPLPTSGALRSRLPASEGARALVKQTRDALRDVLHGRDRRRLVVVAGPCSLHDAGSALEYAARLHDLGRRTGDALVLVMRAYVEKPRTSLGWKGLVNDPHLDGSCDVAAGLAQARRLLRDLGERGVACATEILDPLVAPYLADLVSWAAIGARTTESPVHRQLASGLPFPVGFKNPTDGSLDAAVHALEAADHGHAMLGVDADGRTGIVRTGGNRDGHLVLRGGRTGPNFGPRQVAEAVLRGRERGRERPVVVDCSHENSGGDPARQAGVLRGVLEQVRAGETGIAGIMLESHLRAGRQDRTAGVEPAPDVSLTDACIDWAETEELVLEAAEAVRRAG